MKLAAWFTCWFLVNNSVTAFVSHFDIRSTRQRSGYGFPDGLGHRIVETRVAARAPKVVRVDGLLSADEYDRNQSLDDLVERLSEQLPLVLVRPLTTKTANQVYLPNCRLEGPNGEELSSDSDELVSLSTTLSLATAAAQQTSNIFVSPSGKDPSGDLVQCDIVLDVASLDKLRVRWNTTLGGFGRSNQIRGLSELLLEEDDDRNIKVKQHNLLTVEVNDQSVDAIGETLATLRRAVRSFQESPFVQSLTSNSFPVLSELRDEFLQQVQQQNENSKGQHRGAARLYGTTSLASVTWNETSASEMQMLSALKSSGFPLPGSAAWKRYAKAHPVIVEFANKILPLLSDGIAKESIYEAFSSDCRLLAMDGTILSDGGDNVAEFYRLLASIRQGTLQSWNIQRLSADWKSLAVNVSWVTGKNSPLPVEGCDCFVLDENGSIQQVRQVEVNVGGTRVQDPEWFKAFVNAVRTSGNNAGVEIVMDLLQQVNGVWREPLLDPENSAEVKPLSDQAATAVYRIMYSLHQDVSVLEGPPADQYLASKVQLKGYLGEILANGDGAYRQVLRVALASLRGALRTGQVLWGEQPQSSVKLLEDGVTMELDVVLQLRIQVVPATLLPPSTRSGPPGIPLKIQIVSQYRVNRQGKIVEHRLLETRVNDRLTPGDVVSRFVQGKPIDFSNNNINALQGLLDLVSWARKAPGS